MVAVILAQVLAGLSPIMSKKHVIYFVVGGGLILLYLMWKNKAPISQLVTENKTHQNYISYNAQFDSGAQVPKSNCGCSPKASKILTNTMNEANKQQDIAADKVAEYVASVNNFVMTNIIS